MSLFHVASDDEIKKGATTDIYFVRTKEILQAKGLSKVNVLAEVTAGQLPCDWPWGVVCGIEDEARLLEGFPVTVNAMVEGSIFHNADASGVREPVMTIEGPYGDFCHMETPLLGILCQSSGVATAAARIKKAAGTKIVISFGIRRMHPALSPTIDRASYIGGCDGVSSLSGARTIGKEPMGTMPHALIIALGGQAEAWKAFDEAMPKDVPRIALIDTYYDEKAEAVMAAEALGEKLYGVRLDTPSSRKGNFADIIREVRWELDIRGFRHVKIVVSGGLNEKTVKTLDEAGADAFGVGTALSNAPTIDFALDIVEKEGKPVAKRGKLGGRKQVWRCPRCLVDKVLPIGNAQPKCRLCNGATESMLKPLVKDGKIVAKLESVDRIRERVLRQLENLSI